MPDINPDPLADGTRQGPGPPGPVTAMPYLTPQERRRQAQLARRLPPPDAVRLMDDITAVWPDPTTRPPAAAAAHDQAAANLTRKEN